MRGKWLVRDYIFGRVYICSNCKNKGWEDLKAKYPFCPYCGSDNHDETVGEARQRLSEEIEGLHEECCQAIKSKRKDGIMSQLNAVIIYAQLQDSIEINWNTFSDEQQKIRVAYEESLNVSRMQKWNYDKHEYEEYRPAWEENTHIFYPHDHKGKITCAGCGGKFELGETYTSLQIHSVLGFGFYVCQTCHDKEVKLQQEAEENKTE